jgi:hypothetical protein
MALDLLIYLLIGTGLGCAWNSAEWGRAGWRRIAPSLAAFVLFWPMLLAYGIAAAAIWTQLWRRAHRDDPAVAAAARDPEPALAPEPRHAMLSPSPH